MGTGKIKCYLWDGDHLVSDCHHRQYAKQCIKEKVGDDEDVANWMPGSINSADGEIIKLINDDEDSTKNIIGSTKNNCIKRQARWYI